MYMTVRGRDARAARPEPERIRRGEPRGEEGEEALRGRGAP